MANKRKISQIDTTKTNDKLKKKLKEEEEEEHIDDEIENEQEDDDMIEDDQDNIEEGDQDDDVEEGEEGEEEGGDSENNKKKKKVIKIKAMDPEKIQKLKEENENRGIVYMSTIPARMKPAKLKHLLMKYGNVNRMYLVRGNVERKQHRNDMFKEGWIEFNDKKEARRAATLLNNNPMGGKTRDIHRDCLWNLRYLPKFKWHHLQDKLTTQRMERDKKLKMEINRVRKENLALLEQVKISKHVTAKKSSKDKVVRTFKQRSFHEGNNETLSNSIKKSVISNK
ncbi:hypothetical protein CYY_005680 [Polysphondylium violaceum]|uniref:RRM domain-containing protein n=1 Tax=Polysphondylium violaceum TaxID=133409 RepID=A0A8J4PT46_9MYCE|nr:hypothetical protein CYY_005680 [Polysphondylium violaceum]